MKIYIENFNLTILNEIEKAFHDVLVNSDAIIDVYTNEGIFNIEGNNSFILDPQDKEVKIIKNYFDNYNLIIDYSYFKKTKINSIYGNKHITKKIIRNYYKLNKHSKISLVIDIEENIDNNELIPNDIYFQCNEDININELFIKQEIIEFLSALN
jgi:hypothetical protein